MDINAFGSNIVPAAQDLCVLIDEKHFYIMETEVHGCSAYENLPVQLLVGFACLNQGQHIFYACVTDDLVKLLRDVQKVPQRQWLREVDDNWFDVYSRVVGLFTWKQENVYCGKTGAKNELVKHGSVLYSSAAEYEWYPRISPCVMALIYRENELLLVRGHHHKAGQYTNVAGYIELGESAEQAVEREVAEEVGVHVKNVTYFGSQYWAPSSSLMIGYFCEYVGGEICLDTLELEDGRWFSVDKLPILPGNYTIAGKMISAFIKDRCK